MASAKTRLLLSAMIVALGAGTPALADRVGTDSSGVLGVSSPGFFGAGDSLDGSSGDNLGNHQANADLDMGGNAIVDMGEPLSDGDAATKYYVDVKSAAAKDNLGNHVATRVLDMNGNAITGLSDPSTSTSGVNLRTLQKMIDDIEGDDLGDHKATANLDMSGNRIEFTADPQNPRDVATKQYVDGLVTSIDLPKDISGNRVNSGIGLSGGGPLSSDITLSFDTVWGDGRYALRSRTLSAGDGLDGGGPLSGNLSFKVDGTVVRTSGSQAIEGAKTFKSIRLDGNIQALGNTITGLATPTAGGHAATKGYVDKLYGTGAGLKQTGTTFALADNYLRRSASTDAAGVMAYAGYTRTSGQFYGGNTNPNASVRLNYNGHLYATRFYSGMYLYFSDRNLKENIETVDADAGMELIRKIRPVSYDWKESGDHALGVIAQEVEEVLPMAVKTNEAGIKAVDYVQMIAPLVAAVQSLDARVAALEAAQ